MLTGFVNLGDPYLTECTATVFSSGPGYVILDRTVLYQTEAMAPAEPGELTLMDGRRISIVRAIGLDRYSNRLAHFFHDSTAHIPAGQRVTVSVPWDTRYRHMRVATAIHVLRAAFPYEVIDMKLDSGIGRVRFSVDDSGIDAASLQDIVQALIDRKIRISPVWAPRSDMSSARDRAESTGKDTRSLTRAVRLENLGLQPSGGLYVKNTSEIGAITIIKLEQVGRSRCLVEITLADSKAVQAGAPEHRPPALHLVRY